MTRDDDRDLREAFAALKREEAASVPAFASMPRQTETSRHRRPWFRWALAAVPVAALTVLALWLRTGPEPQSSTADLSSVGTWYTATDVLLEPHGFELLRTLPWQDDKDDTDSSVDPSPTSRLTRRMHT